MKREIIITEDGSSTIHLPDLNEQYHSKHGAIQEAYHVFIKHGLHYFLKSKFNTKNQTEVTILEIGFGTGLNSFISLLEAEKLNVDINYIGVEAYPVLMQEINLLNYPEVLNVIERDNLFKKIHKITWNEIHEITSQFSLTKQQKLFTEIEDENTCHIIYFDAFGARVQPELWTETIFKAMYKALKSKGVLVTYSAKGSVRRAMQSVGFKVEKLPGPPGKREMLRGEKL